MSSKPTIKQTVLKILSLVGANRYWRFRNRHRVTILGFHGVMDFSQETRWDPLRAHHDLAEFRSYLESLKRHYQFISLDQATEILRDAAPPVRNAMVVTFDDGYKNNFTHALPVLRDLDIPATFYVVTELTGNDGIFSYDDLDYLIQEAAKIGGTLPVGDRPVSLKNMGRRELRKVYADLRVHLKTHFVAELEFIAEMDRIIADLARQVGHTLKDARDDDDWSSVVSWEDLRAVCTDSLVDIGSHTETHIRLAFSTADMQKTELENARATIESRLDKRCRNFAYPNGAFNAEAAAATVDAGYSSAVTTVFGLNSVGDELSTLKRVFLPDGLSNSELDGLVSGLSADLGRGIRWLKAVLFRRRGEHAG